MQLDILNYQIDRRILQFDNLILQLDNSNLQLDNSNLQLENSGLQAGKLELQPQNPQRLPFKGSQGNRGYRIRSLMFSSYFSSMSREE
jgi:hypothetical protein